jgi:hypothetical protein
MNPINKRLKLKKNKTDLKPEEKEIDSLLSPPQSAR